ncbi:ParB/RepB/Spo0J family partition protein [Brevundimonas sp. SL130]|uniref:ParB/RepB/Spo0J family partition protein n=1 Tax=Brevundimonas sp. SL130 TaxID=2995143 RepID=UPI00226D3614|nr:ParB/RepB/Spo0J family partition protein [Brevundimonas sp. SL130]WAC61329.1 ParB/RepB/Spo0J family partition protein [Brevundimonas sp. SL130]
MPRSSAARASRVAPETAPEVADAPTPFQITAARVRQFVALRDLGVAPENLRAGEPADNDIPQLADTLFAAGQLQPLTVRPGRRKEKAHMALDGRRRFLALSLLVAQGRIDDGFLVDVFVETDPARQAAAVVLTNTAVPVHVADVIGAIGRMLRAKLEVPVIARALGYAEIEVKRLAALSALPEVALQALKAGRLTLKQAKLLARLPDREEQVELARLALDGHGFQDWRVNERLDVSAVNADDARCTLVGSERYAAAGGRTESDLFGERAPVLLDPALLTEGWMRRAREIALAFEAEGLTVYVTAGGEPDLPDDLETPGYVHGGMLPAAEMAAYREARSCHEAASEAAAEILAETTEPGQVDAILADMIRAKLAMDQIALGGRVVTILVLSPDRWTGIQVRSWTPVEPEVIDDPDPQTEDDWDVDPQVSPFSPPQAAAPEPEVEGVNHALHAVRTEAATRGLIRALADDPKTAMTALIARLFGQIVRRTHGPRSESALAITAQAFNPAGGRVIEMLDGVVRQRLDDRRAAWEASGRTLIGWVHGLDDADRASLLAELTALSLDLREERTSLIRRPARAEAAELAALAGADLTRHWTPDAPFLTPHSKPLLLAMLEAMGQADVRAAVLKKPELVARVAEQAAARRWAPAGLSWTVATDPDGGETGIVEGAGDDGTAADAPGAPGSEDKTDGAGAFEVTASGVDALAHAAE